MKSRLLLSCFIALAAPALAQESLPLLNPKILHVRFPDGAGYRVVDGALLTPAGQSAPNDSLRTLGWWSRTSQVSDARLTQMRETAMRNLERVIPDPTASFHFHVYDASQMEQAFQMLKSSKAVHKVRYVPVPRNASAPNFTNLQTYLRDPRSGINADSVYLMYNNRGAGIQVCDIEYDFHRTHSDLPTVKVLGPTPIQAYGNDHGTAVLGQIGSIQDSIGTTGIASDSKLFFAGAYVKAGQDSIYDLEGPILNAASTFSLGDVILLEQQIYGPNYDAANPASQKGLVPVEWFEPYYDAIELATGSGIIVVEAAGNGQENLDAPAYSIDNDGHYPFSGQKNSGAIVVGAGSVGSAAPVSQPRARLWFSNYGTRLDVQGNGEAITTTGYGDLYSSGGEDNFWTSEFGGTSGASPIVTGAVALLQSYYKQNNPGKVLTPKQMRDMLVNTGQEQLSGPYGNKTTAPIGPLPNVYAAMKLIPKLSVPKTRPSLDATLIPNPATTAVTLRFNVSKAAPVLELAMFDALGRRVYSHRANSAAGEHRIDLSNFPAGIYQVQIGHGEALSTLKLSVLH